VRVLITGAGGFIGQHLVAVALARGHQVRVVTSSPETRFDGRVERFVSADPVRAVDWDDPVSGVDTIVHLAGRAHVLREGSADPLNEFRRANVGVTLALAAAAAQAGVKRLVFASSIGVNGNQTTGAPFTERSVPSPVEHYAISKWEAEQALRDLESRKGLPVTIIRIPLVYGPRVKGNFLRLLKLASLRLPLPLASIRNARSYIGVHNLCDFALVSAEHPAAAGELFLVADGRDISTPDLIARLAEAMGCRNPLVPCPVGWLRTVAKLAGKEGELTRLSSSLRVDATHARQRLGWIPPVEPAAGLDEMARWYRTRVTV
jgi:nucleoside-diphosphate-sugar epimerase